MNFKKKDSSEFNNVIIGAEFGSKHEAFKFVDAFINENKVTVSYSRVIRSGKEVWSREVLLRRLTLSNLDSETKRFSRDDLRDIVDEWIDEARLRQLEDIRRKLSGYDPASEEQLSRLIIAITGREDTTDREVLRHWIWQVKRKLFGKEVGEHLMPILRGKQGSGKTFVVEHRILKPLKELCYRTSVKTLLDPREARLIMDHFVLFLDELAGATKADIEELKRILTTDETKLRVMRTTHHETGASNASYIGACNKPVPDLIMDPTGMRRFYEIPVLDVLDREAINSIDYGVLWKCVSEETPLGGAPYYLVESEVKLRQEQLRHRGPVELWLQDPQCKFELFDVHAPNAKTKPLLAKELLDSFNEWNNCKWDTISFAKQLKAAAGVTSKVTKTGAWYGVRKKNSF